MADKKVEVVDERRQGLDEFSPPERQAANGHSPQRAQALVINAGSSSLKYGLFEVSVSSAQAASAAPHSRLLCSGLVDRVGNKDAKIAHKHVAAGKTMEMELDIPDHAAGLQKVVSLLTAADGPVKDLNEISVVGHRVVHGGESFSEPVVVDEEAEATIERISPLAPLHNPPNLTGIRMAKALFPHCKHVAVFDTAFHSTMPAESYRYALPKELYEKHNVRRYGMHGTSYKFVSAATAEALRRPLVDLNLIVLHLGNGASMACIRKGVCVDTTMGLTPLEGLVMGTRSGDVDCGVYTHLCNNLGMTPKEVDNMLNKKSGLLGVCGTNDMRQVIAAADAGDKDAALARRLFVERVRKYIGAFLVKLSGTVDAIVFTGGIGENDRALRELVCAGLQPLGIDVDAGRNAALKGLGEIQSMFSRAKVMVVPTDEELSIALQSLAIAGAMPKYSGPLKRGRDARRMSGVSARSRSLSTDSKVPPIGSALFVDGVTRTTAEEVGLLCAILPRAPKVGYFLPLADDDAESTINFMRSHFGLSEAPEAMYGLAVEEAIKLIESGEEDYIFEKVLSKYDDYQEGKDFVLVRGGHMPGAPYTWNARMAAALNLPLLFISDIKHEHDLFGLKAAWESQNVRIAGAILSGLPAGEEHPLAAQELTERLDRMDVHPVALIPDDARLNQLTMAEIAHALSCEVIFGKENLDRCIVTGVTVATLQVTDLLDVLSQKGGRIVICDARRWDILLSLTTAVHSSAFPRVAGVLLTGARKLDPTLDALLRGLDRMSMPVLSIDDDSFETAKKINRLKPMLLPGSIAKIETAQLLISQHLDPQFLDALVEPHHDKEVEVTPKLFQHNLFSKARQEKQHIVLPEGEDLRVVAAAGELLARDLCRLTILGNAIEIASLAAKAHVSLDGAVIIDPVASDAEDMVQALYEARKDKGMTPGKARDLIQGDKTWYGTMMMYLNKADGMVSGACHSTANTMRPALQVIKMAPGFSLASSVFFMLLPYGVKVFGDCAINVDPTAEQLAEIAMVSAQTARAFGIAPKVAMLSYATGDSNQGPMIDKVRDATDKFLEKDATVPIEGPIQFDAAVDPAVAAVKFKGKESAVAGQASVLIFPDLNSGNNAYKAVQQASKCIAIGPVMQGLKKPVNDLSRGCTIDDVINTVVITCLQSSAAKAAKKEKASA